MVTENRAPQIVPPRAVLADVSYPEGATGKGTGGVILRDIGAFGYDNLWASIITLTAVSVVLYTLVGLFETFILARFGPAPASH